MPTPRHACACAYLLLVLLVLPCCLMHHAAVAQSRPKHGGAPNQAHIGRSARARAHGALNQAGMGRQAYSPTYYAYSFLTIVLTSQKSNITSLGASSRDREVPWGAGVRTAAAPSVGHTGRSGGSQIGEVVLEEGRSGSERVWRQGHSGGEGDQVRHGRSVQGEGGAVWR